MTQQLEIKAGRYYRLRNGRRVFIYSTTRHDVYPTTKCGNELCVVGEVFSEHGLIEIKVWALDGSFAGETHPLDIISECAPIFYHWDALPAWSDRWISMDVSGVWYCSSDKPHNRDSIKRDSMWCYNNTVVEIPRGHLTPTYTGDWKDSLLENPKYKNQSRERSTIVMDTRQKERIITKAF